MWLVPRKSMEIKTPLHHKKLIPLKRFFKQYFRRKIGSLNVTQCHSVSVEPLIWRLEDYEKLNSEKSPETEA